MPDVPIGMGAVTPYSLHLMAQLIRHQRGIVTSLEKWINSPGFSKDEALEATRYVRRVLDAYERSLASYTDGSEQS